MCQPFRRPLFYSTTTVSLAMGVFQYSECQQISRQTIQPFHIPSLLLYPILEDISYSASTPPVSPPFLVFTLFPPTGPSADQLPPEC